MDRFPSAREAKEFLISRIVDEAHREGDPLSETERKMLYFSETGWTLPDITEVSDEFDRTCDQAEYERKIAHLVKSAYKRVCNDSPEDYDAWWRAIRLLSKQDHYILVMIRGAGLRPRGDALKLWGTGLAIVVLLICLTFTQAYITDRYKVDFGKYWPFQSSREGIAVIVWVTMASVVIGYALLRLIFGKRIDGLIGKVIERMFRILGH